MEPADRALFFVRLGFVLSEFSSSSKSFKLFFSSDVDITAKQKSEQRTLAKVVRYYSDNDLSRFELLEHVK